MIKIPGRQLIIVDIQPAYEPNCKHFMHEFIQAINNYEGNILYLFNGPDLGFENEHEIQDWLMSYAETIWELDYDEETDEYLPNNELENFRDKISEFYFVEKSYGFIRNTLDEGFKEETLEIVQYLIAHDINDASEIPDEDLEDLELDETLKENLINENWSITLPSFNFNILKHWSGATLIGGGENECLLEIEVLLNAMNIPYTTFRPFIY